MSRSILPREARAVAKDLSPAELRGMGVSVLRDRPGPGFLAIGRNASLDDVARHADASIELLYCGGILHRFPREEADALVGACFRILKPFGTLRIATIDLDDIVHAYLLGWTGEADVSRTRQLNAALRQRNVEFVYGEEELTIC